MKQANLPQALDIELAVIDIQDEDDVALTRNKAYQLSIALGGLSNGLSNDLSNNLRASQIAAKISNQCRLVIGERVRVRVMLIKNEQKVCWQFRDMNIEHGLRNWPNDELIRAAQKYLSKLSAKHSVQRLQLISTLFQVSGEGILITDSKHCIQSVNPAFESITGYTETEVLGQNAKLLNSDYHEALFYQQIWQAVQREGSWNGEIHHQCKNGDLHPAWYTITAVRETNEHISNYIITFSDLRQQTTDKQQLYYLAHYDALTELPNRSLFHQSIQRELAVAKRNKTKLAIIFLDLDHFKEVNDTHGHGAGDILLKEVAQRLQSCIRDTDTIARLGGDEFAGILTGIVKPSDAIVVIQKIIAAIDRPIAVSKDVEVSVTTSVGISFFPEDGENIEDLTKHADAAMYQAKETGRNGYALYEPAINDALHQRMIMIEQIKKAICNHEFELFYQPKYTVDGQITGMEALIRWNQPEQGMISPLDFIPLAEETGLIHDIGLWVIQEACRQNKIWQDAGYQALCIAVNLSCKQFNDAALIDKVMDALSAQSLGRQYLELEITESILMTDAEANISIMQALHDLGLHLTIDDFGTGYSSLSYLKNFPVSKLKLDRSFIMGLPEDESDAKIVAAMTALAHNLEMKVVAEGVETAEQLAHMKSINCDEIQGYYFSRPLNAADMTALLQQPS